MSKLKLSQLEDNYGCLRDIRQRSSANTPRYFMLGNSVQDIVFFSLQIFNFKSPIAKDDPAAITAGALKVLTQCGYYENGYLADLWHKENEPDIDPINHYFKYILGFGQLPSEFLSALSGKVNNDLKEVLELIDRYESERYIQEYLKTGEKRGEHEAKIRFDFYDRCLLERDAIVKYLARDMEDRAITRARNDGVLTGGSFGWFEEYGDRPYKWWQHSAILYFDYRQINDFKHRLSNVLVRFIPELTKLYRGGKKQKFYKKLKGYVPVNAVFEQIFNFYIPHIPKVQDRKPVFIELQGLMKKKNWLGFTALALTQVEGIFSDMLDIVNPQGKYSSLPKKVFAVRPFYDYHQSSFDYFECILPRLRNGFLHIGKVKDKDFEIHSYDLLYDLHYLLNVFHELNEPSLKLHRMLNGDIDHDLVSIKNFLDIFELVKKVKQHHKENKQVKEIADVVKKWDDYERDVLAPSGNLEYFAEQIHTQLRDLTDGFYQTIFFNTEIQGNALDLKMMSIATLRVETENIINTLKEYNYSFKDQYDRIMNMHTFISQYRDYLVSAPQIVVDTLKAVKSSESDNHKKLIAMEPAFKIDYSE